jgi:biotin operon repressor
MNAMTQALKTAGVKTPSQYQRIWQWLKDNGPNSVKTLASELKIADTSVAAAITDMKRRGMVIAKPQVDARGKRMAMWYEAVGREYELLPLPKKAAPAATAATAPAPRADITYASIVLRVPRGVAKIYEDHAKEFGVGVDDVLRLALEAYGRKMGLPMMTLDPLTTLRRKLEGGV